MNPSESDILAGYVIVVLIVYFLPFYIALVRKHSKRWMIFFVNLILGWTFIAWAILIFYSAFSKSMEEERDGFR